MSKNYAVYHLEKGSISCGGIGNHIDRIKGKEHSFRHADPDKLYLNRRFNLNAYCSMPLHEAIEKRIAEGYKTPKAIRKDAVKYTTHILTGSHEKMKKIEDNPKELKSWVIQNKMFLEEEFGKDNIVRFVLHRDEKTPHLHAVTVNLTLDGRLSAKEIIGNRKKMQERQDKYALKMAYFGLSRGIKSTGIKHEDAKKYYTRIKESLDVGDKSEIKLLKKILGTYKRESIEELKNTLKSQKTTLKSNDWEIKKLKQDKRAIISQRNLLEKVKKEQLLKITSDLKEKEIQLRNALFTPFQDELEYLKNQLKQKTLHLLDNDIQKAKEPLDISQVDTIIRTRMIELNPKGNPWSTLKHVFGEDMKDKIFKAAKIKNEQLKLQKIKNSASQEAEQQKLSIKIKKNRRKRL